MLVIEAAIEWKSYGRSKSDISALLVGHLKKLPLSLLTGMGEVLPRDVGLKIHPMKICFIICLSGKNEIINTYIGIEESQIQSLINIILFSLVHLNVYSYGAVFPNW